jgi:hypothetical protein
MFGLFTKNWAILKNHLATMVSNGLAIVWEYFQKWAIFFKSFGHTAFSKTGVQ